MGEFPALPHVPEELRDAESELGGRVLLNESFQLRRFADLISESEPAVVHIASHGRFTGDPAYFKHITGAAKGIMDKAGMKPDDFYQHWCQTEIPLGREQTPEDIGRTALFLATMDNITGQAVFVTGGNPCGL